MYLVIIITILIYLIYLLFIINAILSLKIVIGKKINFENEGQ